MLTNCEIFSIYVLGLSFDTLAENAIDSDLQDVYQVKLINMTKIH